MKHSISLQEAQKIVARHIAKELGMTEGQYRILYQTSIELTPFMRQVDPVNSYMEFTFLKEK